MKILDENFAEVLFNPKIQAVEVKWKDHATLQQYKRVMENAYSLIVQTNCKNWVANIPQGRLLPKDATEWFKREFVPKVVRQGVHKTALLFEDAHTQLFYDKSVKNSMEYCGAEMQFFENREELESWIVR